MNRSSGEPAINSSRIGDLLVSRIAAPAARTGISSAVLKAWSTSSPNRSRPAHALRSGASTRPSRTTIFTVSISASSSVCHRFPKRAASAGGLQESSWSDRAVLVRGRGRAVPTSARALTLSPPRSRASPGGSKRPRVDRARPADFRRVIRRELIAEGLVVRAVPDGQGAALSHAAKLDSVRSGDHATGHCKTLVADVSTTPGPVATLGAGSSGRVKPRAHAGKTKIHAKLAGHAARLVEMALDPIGILGRQGLGRHEIGNFSKMSGRMAWQLVESGHAIDSARDS